MPRLNAQIKQKATLTYISISQSGKKTKKKSNENRGKKIIMIKQKLSLKTQ